VPAPGLSCRLCDGGVNGWLSSQVRYTQRSGGPSNSTEILASIVQEATIMLESEVDDVVDCLRMATAAWFVGTLGLHKFMLPREASGKT
jgi:hypothetical protein